MGYANNCIAMLTMAGCALERSAIRLLLADRRTLVSFLKAGFVFDELLSSLEDERLKIPTSRLCVIERILTQRHRI